MDEEKLAAREQAKGAFTENLMQDPDFLAKVRAMPADEREQYIEQLFRDYNGETAMANEDLTRASEMLKTPTAEGRQAGRVYVAANPLEHIGTAMARIKGGNMRDETMGKMKELSDSRSQGLQTTGNMLQQQPLPNVMTDPNTGQQTVDQGAKDVFQQRLAAKMLRDKEYGVGT